MANINKINRFKEIPKNGLFCDLVWSDPQKEESGKQDNMYVKNSDRKCSYIYGIQAVTKFLKMNKLLSVIRAHEVQLEGFKMHQWGKKFPVVVTIFSAPNYCNKYKNKGAIICLKDNDFNIEQYHSTVSPYYLPKFMDLFTWSIPFASEKLTEMILNLYKYIQSLEDTSYDSDRFLDTIKNLEENKEDKDFLIKVSALKKMYKLLKETN